MPLTVFITDKNTTEELRYVDYKTGIDSVNDLLGNAGAFQYGDLDIDDETGQVITNAENFRWWSAYVEGEQKLADRIAALIDEHGSGKVYDVIENFPHCDLEYQAAYAMDILDQEFGKQ